MGQTTRYELPYPEDTDLVMDGAAAMKALAEKVEEEFRFRVRRGGRGRETFTNPPMPGETRVRTVAFAGDGFVDDSALPRISLTTGGDRLIDGMPFMATLGVVTPVEFEIILYPLAPPSQSHGYTGSVVTVDWIAMGTD